MTTGTSPTLTLRIRAPEALAAFKELATAAGVLRAELAALSSGGGGGAAFTRMNAEVKELRAAVEASRREVEILTKQLAERSRVTVKGAADEEKAVKQRHAAERTEVQKTADAKKKADDDAAAHQTYLRKVMLSSALMEGRVAGGTLGVVGNAGIGQSRDMQVYLQRQQEELRLRSQGALQAKAQMDDENRTRATGVIQYRAIAEDDARTRAVGVTQYRAGLENEARTRALGITQARAQNEEEARTHRAQVAQGESFLAERRVLLSRIAAQNAAEAEEVRRAAAAQRAAAAAQAASAREQAAATASAGRDQSGLARSAARGAAAAGGGMFLTYGSNIPALAATFAAGSAIKESITQGAEFEKQMKFVKVASEDSAEAIARVSKEILDMGGKTIFAPIEMAKGMRVLAQAGFDTKDAYAALIPVMNLAAIGEQTVGQAAETAAGLMHAFGLATTDISHISDTLAKAANLSQTNVNEMSQAMRQASTVAQQYNVNIDEMGALLAVLAQRNIRGSAAGTSLMNMFRELDPATATARRAFKQLNVEVTDGEGNFKKIIPLIQEFSKKLQGYDQLSQSRIIKDYLNNRADKGFFAAIAQSSEKNGDLPKFFKEIQGAAGYAQKSVDELSKSVSFMWETLKNAISSQLIKAFDTESIKKSLKDITETINDPKTLEGLTMMVGSFTKLFALVMEYGPKVSKVLMEWSGPLGGVVQALKVLGLMPEELSPEARAKNQAGKWKSIRLGQGVGSRPFLDDEPLVDIAEKAAGGKKHYERLDPMEEAVKKARAAQVEAIAKKDLAAEEQRMKQSLSILDLKHKYQLISETDYLTQVEALEDRRMATEKAQVDAAIADVTRKIPGMKLEQDRIRETTHLIELRGRQERLAVDATNVMELRTQKIEGERAQREREAKGLAARRTEEISEIGVKMELQRRKAREHVEGALSPTSLNVQNEARLAVEEHYLSEQKKLKVELAELEAKSDQFSKDKLEQLRPLLELLEKQKHIQSDIAASEALANHERQREFSYGWKQAYKEYAEDATNAARQARDVFTASANGIEDAITKLLSGTKVSFKDLANTIVVELARIQAKKLTAGIMGAIDNFLKPSTAAAAGSTAGTSGDMLMAYAANAGMGMPYHGGGIVGDSRPGRYVSPLAWLGASRFHGGGIAGDEVPVIAKRGEGVFTAEQMARMAPVNSGSGGLTVKIALENKSSTPIQVTQSKPQINGRELIVSAVIEDLRSNGPISQGMQGTFNMSRGRGW